MSTQDALIALAQFALTLAGFIGALVTFVGRAGEWHAADAFRTWRALVTSLGVAFMAMLPIALQGLGLAETARWRASSAFAVCHGLAWLGADMLRYARERAQLRGVVPTWSACVVYATAASVLAAQCLCALGAWPGSQPGVYFTALLCTLLLPAIALARIPFVRPAPAPFIAAARSDPSTRPPRRGRRDRGSRAGP